MSQAQLFSSHTDIEEEEPYPIEIIEGCRPKLNLDLENVKDSIIKVRRELEISKALFNHRLSEKRRIELKDIKEKKEIYNKRIMIDLTKKITQRTFKYYNYPGEKNSPKHKKKPQSNNDLKGAQNKKVDFKGVAKGKKSRTVNGFDSHQYLPLLTKDTDNPFFSLSERIKIFNQRVQQALYGYPKDIAKVCINPESDSTSISSSIGSLRSGYFFYESHNQF